LRNCSQRRRFANSDKDLPNGIALALNAVRSAPGCTGYQAESGFGPNAAKEIQREENTEE
jgi:hypothetical protein